MVSFVAICCYLLYWLWYRRCNPIVTSTQDPSRILLVVIAMITRLLFSIDQLILVLFMLVIAKIPNWTAVFHVFESFERDGYWETNSTSLGLWRWHQLPLLQTLVLPQRKCFGKMVVVTVGVYNDLGGRLMLITRWFDTGWVMAPVNGWY